MKLHFVKLLAYIHESHVRIRENLAIDNTKFENEKQKQDSFPLFPKIRQAGSPIWSKKDLLGILHLPLYFYGQDVSMISCINYDNHLYKHNICQNLLMLS